MPNRLQRSIAAVATALLVLLSNAPVAQAATSAGPGNGLRVSPVRTDLTINPGQTKTVTINITNVTSAAAAYQAVVNDFIANPDESGQPALLLSPNQYAQSHSLKRFVAPISNFSLAAGQQTAVTVTITVPSGAAGGGYYGVVRFAPANNSSGQVSLAGSVGSLILVTVPGKIVDKLTIASFDARVKDRPNSFFTHNKNIDAVVRFQNEGNIQEEPFGKILLKNRSGKTLASYEINNVSPPANVLPDSIRKFPIPLTKVGSFGEYKLEGNFGYGTNGQLLSASTTFYVIPVWLIIGFIVLVALVILAVWGVPRLIRAYNARVLRRAGRR